MSDLQVSHALSTHTCSLTNTQWHIHTEVQIGYQSKIRGNKRSDRMPRQQTSLWFTDRPGNTLTPLPADTHAENTHTHAHTDTFTHASAHDRAQTQAHTYRHREECAHIHTHISKKWHTHFTSNHITSHWVWGRPSVLVEREQSRLKVLSKNVTKPQHHQTCLNHS